ncbi:sensor histidine kinase [Aurantibacillus circumpalustris]|uniref:sensor histidine kinase n=1 Tax=Aurantibacillus circumpalustris TaxID=3036359 RepID=UPI00295BF031|nr:sensor histidine kinase [Aurantibacillus circumpalustris]
MSIRISWKEITKLVALKFEKLVLIGSSGESLSEKEREYIIYTNRIMYSLIVFQYLLIVITLPFSRDIGLILVELLLPLATAIGQIFKWLKKFYLSSSFLIIISVIVIVSLDKIYYRSQGEEGGFFLYVFLILFIFNKTLRYSTYSSLKKAILYLYPICGILFWFLNFILSKNMNAMHQISINSMFFINVIFVFAIMMFLLMLQISLNNKLAKKVQNKQRKIVKIIEKNNFYAINAGIVAEEKEKKRFSEELHDSVGQLLATTISNMDLLTIEETSDKLTQETVSSCMALLRMAMSEVRSISHNLMPAVLIDFGLCEAINGVCTNARLKNGLKIVFYSERDIKNEFRPGNEISLHLYRIVQESVGNILKHSGATNASITLISNRDHYVLSVIDDGKGFSNNAKRGNGLSNIKKRAYAIGAELIIESELSIGTTVTVNIKKDKKNNLHECKHELAEN